MRWQVSEMNTRGNILFIGIIGLLILVILAVLIVRNSPNVDNQITGVVHNLSIPNNISTLPNINVSALINNVSTFVCSNCSFSVRTKTANCSFDYLPLPDPKCTTGAIFPNATKDVICVSGYSASVRDVSESLKNQVYESYGVYNRQPYEFEIDHLVSLENGGNNEISNLFPEKYNMTLGAYDKDKIENCFHRKVCDGTLDLTLAQYIMAKNWTLGIAMCGD